MSIKNLIIPICGKSTRFPGVKPKWMLTHPNGDFMGIAAIPGINLEFFDKIYFIALAIHEQEYHFLKGFQENLKDHNLHKKSKIILLDNETKSQPETVYQGIVKENINGFIFIKDSDNYFDIKIKSTKNQIAFCSLTDFSEINPNNKSYIRLNENNILENIIEKEIISTTFCCGGYGFQDSKKFINSYKKLSQLEDDLYISDIIHDLILEDNIFYGLKSSNYLDWGTLKEWRKYTDSFRVIFSDLDGTLVKNSSSHFPPYIGDSEPLQNNIDHLKSLKNTYIVITTSRAEKFRKITENQLKKLKIPYNQLIMGLLHSKRYLINDHSSTNIFPTSIAINLNRNSDNLKDYL